MPQTTQSCRGNKPIQEIPSSGAEIMSIFLKDEYLESSSLPTLKPILEEWIAVQHEYTRQVRGEFSWNYSERASIGFLAAAVWAAGGVALEEWCTVKGTRKEPRNGRCDLFIYRNKQSFDIEAKHLWLKVTSNQENKIDQIKRALERTVSDAKHLPRQKKHHRLAVLFVAPFYPPLKSRDALNHIEELLKGICRIPHSAIAWLFHGRQTLKPDKKRNVVQGIVLIIRAVGART